MKIKSDSDLMPNELKPDTYTLYEIDDWIDWNDEADHRGCEPDDIQVDFEGYKQDLGARLYQWYIDELNPDLPDWIQFVEVDKVDVKSPKYYNYGTDSMNIEIEVDKKKMDKFIKQNEKELDKFLEKNRSHDGFISITPASYYELINEDDIERVVMCVVDYLLSEEKYMPRMDFEPSIAYDNIYVDDLVKSSKN